MPPKSMSKLVALLLPWKATFSNMSVSSLCTNRDGVVDITVSMPSTPDPLHEAMDLLRVAIIVDGAILRELIQRKWIHDFHHKMREKGEGFDKGVRGVAFTVWHGGLEAHAFTKELKRFLATSMAQTSSQYSATRDKLILKITSHSLLQRLGESVPLECRVELDEDRSDKRRWPNEELIVPFPLSVEDFFKQLTDMAAHLRSYRQTRSEGTCMRFEVVRIHLKLEMCLPITPSIVEAVEAFMQADDAGRVQCTEVKLDPRFISCNGEDLLRYVQALSRGSPGLSISTGYTPLGNHMPRLDANGESRQEMIVDIMRAIASCPCLDSVDLGPLLHLLVSPPNRKCVWRAVLEILLTPSNPNPINEFVIDSDTIITDKDATSIKSLRRVRTCARRPVKRFRLSAKNASDTAILAALALVRDMQKVDVCFQLASVASSTVTTILQRYPNLKSLRVCGATIDSMAVFSDPTLRSHGSTPGVCLEKLDLFTPYIADRSSFAPFLRELLDATSPIAKTLRYLGFECPTNEAGCEFDVACATLLKQILETNKTLSTVEVMLDSDVPLALQKALLSHHGDIISKKGPIPEHQARKLAFLSVIQATEQDEVASALCSLDGAMVREIFAFMAPYDERIVWVSYVEEEEEGVSDEDDGSD